MVLNLRLIWPSIPFVCLIFCHCPKAKSSLEQWSCLVFGTVSFPGYLYAHLCWHITNNKSRAPSGRGSTFYCQLHGSCGGWESRVVQEQAYSHHLLASGVRSCPGPLAEPLESLFLNTEQPRKQPRVKTVWIGAARVMVATVLQMKCLPTLCALGTDDGW